MVGCYVEMLLSFEAGFNGIIIRKKKCKFSSAKPPLFFVGLSSY